MKKKKLVKELKDILPPVRNDLDRWEVEFKNLAVGKCYEIQKEHYFPVRRFFIEKGFKLRRQLDKEKDVYRIWALAIEG